ncbi:MAG: NADH-quinone oxidoreductase subunit L [Planctomycetota bacterium]
MLSLLAWMVPLSALLGCLICTVMAFRGDTKSAHLPAVASLLLAAASALGLWLFGAQGSEGVQIYNGYRYLQIGTLTLDIALRVDTLCLTLLTIVTFISAMIAIYSRDYMRGDPGYARYFAVFCGFVFSMTMLVLSHNLLMMYAFWEGVGTCSYLLIGYWYRKPSAARAATKAFLVNRIADTAFLFGILLLGYAVGQTDPGAGQGWLARLNFDSIFNAAPVLAQQHAGLLTAIGMCLMIGAIGKSAQFPFHVWLPDAMEGPTPVSALIHAATMVTAGVFLMARLSPLTELTPTVLTTVAWLGGITALIGAWMAMFQDDLKRVLAYSTVSQLGYLFMALGAGAVKELMSVAVVAAMFHLVTHAFFKALLFLSAGNVMHAMGDVIDMKQFSGLRRILPKTHVLFAIGAAALAGLPPLAGFFSKDGILGVLSEAGNDMLVGNHFRALLGIGFVTAFLTAIYTSMAFFRTFYGAEKVPAEAGDHAHEATATMLAPMAVLAVGAVVVGVALGPTGLLERYVTETPGFHHSEHHEPTWILIASALIAVAGAVIGYRLSKLDPHTSWLRNLAVADWGRNRLYIDWFFERVFVAPMEWFARLCRWFDGVVDGLVRVVADSPRWLGLAGQRLQTGRIPTYSFITAIGIAALAIWIVTRSNW